MSLHIEIQNIIKLDVTIKKLEIWNLKINILISHVKTKILLNYEIT
jgi:hypothetical protein